MAGTLTARELHKAHGAATILAGVSVTVAPGDVLGVVGPNGAGKSTLLRILAGLDRPDRGSVRLSAGTAGYLPQEPDRAPGERLEDYLARRTGVAAAHARVEAATHELAAHAPGAADRYAEAFEAWLALGGADLEPRAAAVLRDLGLDPALLDLETTALSGGEAARASLAAILLSRFDVLLLDEPTNDLDFDGLARLERFVAERPGGAVIVSHDRAFLARTVTRVLELDEIAHTAAEYGGGWAGYLELRATAARHAEERYDAYATERDRLTDRARRQRQWSETGVRRAKDSTDPDKIGRAKRAERSEKQAAKVRATEKAIDRLDVGRQAVAALGAAAALRRRRALRRRHRAAGACRAAARHVHARPARRRAGVGRARRARRPEREREDDAGRRPHRPAAARRGHALGRPGRPARHARPGAARVRRRRDAARRVRRPERAVTAGGALAAGQVRARARGRGTRRGGASRRASGRGRASRC